MYGSLKRRRGTALFIGVIVALCGLCYYGTGIAAERRQPFANATAQRAEIIEQLRELNRLLAEQNALLQSGELKVRVQP